MSELEWLFAHLWTKPHMVSINNSDPHEFEAVKQKRKGMLVVKFPFRIPDTLVFRDGKLQSWYFRGKEEVVLK
jgi:hypothetical protein